MRLSALNRLRLAFVAIGVLLLLPLALLASSVTARLEAQRRLRHEVVAERIFDELERELTAVLSQESARPSSVYDSSEMDAAPPYVLGYFTAAVGEPRITFVKPGGDGEKRLRWAIGAWGRGMEQPAQSQPGARASAPAAHAERQAPPPAASAPPAKSQAPAPRSSPEILRKLNRGELERQQEFGY